MKKSFIMLFACCVSLAGQAEDYYLKPVFRADEHYYSNLFLREVPLQDNWITTLSPGLSFGMLTENSSLTSNFIWNHLFYTNQSELDIDEQLFSVGYQHNNTGRLQWGFDGFYNNRSSLNTEGTVNGLFFSQVMSKQLSLAPSVTYSLDELNSLSLDYSYNNTTYEKNQNFALSDYDYHQLSGTFNHLYSELDKFNLTLSSSRYKAKFQNQTILNHVAQLGWQHSFSEQLATYVSAGLNYSQAESTQQIPAQCALELSLVSSPCFPFRFVPASEVTTQTNGFGQVYRAYIQKSFDRGSVSLVGSQDQTPSSQGLQTQMQIALSTAYTINERWHTGVSASYSTYEITGQQNGSNNRTSYSISPTIDWKWTPEINLLFSYTYHQQEFEGGSQPSVGNVVQFTFLYQPQINHQVK
jgi:hypothetical protein